LPECREFPREKERGKGGKKTRISAKQHDILRRARDRDWGGGKKKKEKGGESTLQSFSPVPMCNFGKRKGKKEERGGGKTSVDYPILRLLRNAALGKRKKKKEKKKKKKRRQP